MGFMTRTTSISGRPEISNSSFWLLRVSVQTSVNPSPTMTSLRLSEKVVSGRRPPGVCSTLYGPPNLSNPNPVATSS